MNFGAFIPTHALIDLIEANKKQLYDSESRPLPDNMQVETVTISLPPSHGLTISLRDKDTPPGVSVTDQWLGNLIWMKGECAPGLTPEEREAVMFLAHAWDKFAALPVEHPSDQAEFVDAIHKAQRLVAIRVARRLEPDVWVRLVGDVM